MRLPHDHTNFGIGTLGSDHDPSCPRLSPQVVVYPTCGALKKCRPRASLRSGGIHVFLAESKTWMAGTSRDERGHDAETLRTANEPCFLPTRLDQRADLSLGAARTAEHVAHRARSD